MRPRELYQKLREEVGHPLLKLMGERDLLAWAEPDVLEEVIRYEELFDPESLLAEYKRKLHSVTWDMPDELNERIVGEMRKRLGEKRLQTRSLKLVGWSRKKLQGVHPST